MFFRLCPGGVLAAMTVVAFLIWLNPATAETDAATTELQQAYDAAFQAMLEDPANLGKTFRFAELAIQVKNFEAAIGALERMLLIDTNLPRIRLELGVLYFRLGSYAAARGYLERAIEGDDVPATVRARVERFLADIDKRTAKHRFSGSIYGGLRYQTNANAGPGANRVRAAGFNANLEDEFTDQADSNVFLATNLRHVYDLQRHNGEEWRTSGVFYGSKQNQEDQVDVAFVELKTGLNGRLFPDALAKTEFYPFVIGNYVYLEDDPYFYAFGGGLEVTNEFSDRLRATFGGVIKARFFNDTNDRPNSSDRDGLEIDGKLKIDYALSPRTMLSVTGLVVDQEAEEDFESNTRYGVILSWAQGFQIPQLPTPGPAFFSVSLGRIYTTFEDPDAFVDPNKSRDDREWRFDVLLAVPVAEAFSIVTTVGRRQVSSNIPNFRFDNNYVSLGGAYRF